MLWGLPGCPVSEILESWHSSVGLIVFLYVRDQGPQIASQEQNRQNGTAIKWEPGREEVVGQ